MKPDGKRPECRNSHYVNLVLGARAEVLNFAAWRLPETRESQWNVENEITVETKVEDRSQEINKMARIKSLRTMDPTLAEDTKRLFHNSL